jgi:hypothetical protein
VTKNDQIFDIYSVKTIPIYPNNVDLYFTKKSIPTGRLFYKETLILYWQHSFKSNFRPYKIWQNLPTHFDKTSHAPLASATTILFDQIRQTQVVTKGMENMKFILSYESVTPARQNQSIFRENRD